MEEQLKGSRSETSRTKQADGTELRRCNKSQSLNLGGDTSKFFHHCFASLLSHFDDNEDDDDDAADCDQDGDDVSRQANAAIFQVDVVAAVVATVATTKNAIVVVKLLYCC